METKPQLQAVQVTGYRNLEIETPFELSNLNILIGANGSGKSNLLEAIAFLPNALENGLSETFKKRRSASSVVNLNREYPTTINLSWQLPAHEKFTYGIDLKYSVSIEIDQNGRFSVKQEGLAEVKPRFSNQLEPYKHLDFNYGEGTASPWVEGGLRRVANREEFEKFSTTGSRHSKWYTGLSSAGICP